MERTIPSLLPSPALRLRRETVLPFALEEGSGEVPVGQKTRPVDTKDGREWERREERTVSTTQITQPVPPKDDKAM
jgi:hypothetical protein